MRWKIEPHDLRKKPRAFRQESLGETHIEDDGHGWAVSYADLLMVLLSFFVIFFSQDKARTDGIINQIVAFQGKETDKTGRDEPGTGGVGKRDLFRGIAASSTGDIDKPGDDPGKSLAEKISEDIETMQLELDPAEGKATFMMPDDVYPVSSVELDDRHRQDLKKLLERLLVYKDKVELVFVGHADTLAFRDIPRIVIKNNYDLSAIRATRAIAMAVDIGWPKDVLFSKGASEIERNSRTLSLVIKDKRERNPNPGGR